MNQRQTEIFNELVNKCVDKKTTEFEYFVEIWGVMWYPWFIEINGKNQTFKHNDISSEDLKLFCELGLIELIKTYTKDDYDHDIYRIKKKQQVTAILN